MVELVDTLDSKSCERKLVTVQVRLAAPNSFYRMLCVINHAGRQSLERLFWCLKPPDCGPASRCNLVIPARRFGATNSSVDGDKISFKVLNGYGDFMIFGEAM